MPLWECNFSLVAYASLEIGKFIVIMFFTKMLPKATFQFASRSKTSLISSLTARKGIANLTFQRIAMLHDLSLF